MFTSLSKKKIFFIYLFFSIYFFAGLIFFKDFGFAFDEDIQRKIAINNLNFIKDFFNFSLQEKTKLLHPYYGVAFELPAMILENLFKIEDIHNKFLFRHLLIFLFSFIGSIFFFLIVLKHYKSIILSIFGLLLLILSPRIFAESFYNSKDIIFMYAFVIATYFSIIFLEKPNKVNIFFFSLTSAFLINIRILGIILPLIILVIFFIKYLRGNFKNFYFNFIFCFILLLIFTILMWPALWSEPFKNITNAFLVFKSYNIEIFNFYLSDHTNAKNLHWYYVPLWIAVTTPPIILFLFIVGILLILKRLLKRLVNIEDSKPNNDLWRGKTEMIDIIFIMIIFLPLCLVIFFNSTLYSGWRHLYFIYPFIIIVSINPMYQFRIIKLKYFSFLCSTLALILIYYLYWNVKFHPFQFTYFNSIAGKEIHNKFDVDYWGLSNRYSLEYILLNNKNKRVNVSNVSDTNLIHNIKILRKEKRLYLNYEPDLEKSDFIIDNNNFFDPVNKKRRKILNRFKVYHQLFVDDVLVTTIYKKR